MKELMVKKQLIIWRERGRTLTLGYRTEGEDESYIGWLFYDAKGNLTEKSSNSLRELIERGYTPIYHNSKVPDNVKGKISKIEKKVRSQEELSK